MEAKAKGVAKLPKALVWGRPSLLVVIGKILSALHLRLENLTSKQEDLA